MDVWHQRQATTAPPAREGLGSNPSSGKQQTLMKGDLGPAWFTPWLLDTLQERPSRYKLNLSLPPPNFQTAADRGQPPARPVHQPDLLFCVWLRGRGHVLGLPGQLPFLPSGLDTCGPGWPELGGCGHAWGGLLRARGLMICTFIVGVLRRTGVLGGGFVPGGARRGRLRGCTPKHLPHCVPACHMRHPWALPGT